VDEEDLILIVLNDARELRPAANKVRLRELALEHRVLQVIAVAPHGFEDLAKPLIIRNVITDQIRLAHGL